MDSADIAHETRRYYDQRAREYEETIGLDQQQQRESDLTDSIIASHEAERILDVGCGTGRVTRLPKGWVVGLDPSERMLDIARRRVPGARFVRSVAPPVPFATGSFDLVLAAHLFSHLEPGVRPSFVAEAKRVARSLMIVELRWEPGLPTDELEDRELSDGSRFRIRKTYFTPEGLLDELGGGTILFQGRWFMVASVDFADTG